MAITQHAVTTATYHDTITDIGSTTNRRDVSELLDLWAHKDTPLLNRISWGPESGGLNIEWISEHLGYGYLEAAAAAASGSMTVSIGASGLASVGAAIDQVTSGTLLFAYSSTDSEVALLLIESITSPVMTFEYIAITASSALSIAASMRFYILGSLANEASGPRADRSRLRSAITNAMAILREDVQISGSMMSTDMHAVDNELKHQIRMRLKEMQRHREMILLFAKAVTRSGTVAGIFNGCFGFLESQSGDNIQASSMDFTETAVNDMAAEIYDNGGTPNVLVGPIHQLRKFTQWDVARIRTTPDARLSGHNVTKYLTEVGIEVDLVMMRKFPPNVVFMLDTDKIKLRAKKGRKLLVQKLGLDGDRERWQMLSEFSVEMRGYDKGQHGIWYKLASGKTAI